MKLPQASSARYIWDFASLEPRSNEYADVDYVRQRFASQL
jgi:hypothetical protein